MAVTAVFRILTVPDCHHKQRFPRKSAENPCERTPPNQSHPLDNGHARRGELRAPTAKGDELLEEGAELHAAVLGDLPEGPHLGEGLDGAPRVAERVGRRRAAGRE